MDTANGIGEAPSSRADAGAEPRGLHGLGRVGVAVIVSLNTTAKFLVTEPVGTWLRVFVQDVAVHSFIGVAMLLAAVWARNRVHRRGARQYAAAFAAVIVATAAAVVVVEGIDSGGTFGVGPEDATLAGLADF